MEGHRRSRAAGAAALTTVALVALAALATRCAGSANPAVCSTIPACPEIGCCNADTLCRSTVCQGVTWLCRRVPEGLRWLTGSDQCPSPLPDATVPDGPPPADADAGGGCTATSCGGNAECVAGACACKQGYVNADTVWSNGCEAIDPACKWTNCGHCPADYCGANAECRDNVKCRCADINFKETLDANGVFLGCLTPTSNCRPDNCNQCYTGYCGPAADCRQNKCKCTDAAWVNCDGKWERSGCECNKTCSGGVCQ